MKPIKLFLTSASLAMVAAGTLPGAAAAQVRNVVLVHGMNADGSTWRSVFDQLDGEGYEVTVVQLPLTSIEDDIAATRRIIDAQDGPVVLVGHSYGGMVISQAGTDPKVEALVYVAAFLPEIGESLAMLNASVPADLPQSAIRVFEDGTYLVEPEAWIADVANGLSEADARFSAMSQATSNTAIFGYEAEAAAWHDVPSWAAVATEDRTIAPELQRQMADRSGATVVEIDGGHMLPMSHPNEVAALIKDAAAADGSTP
jgi:pimeloyl-ACP methyl ester carboxylesterase